MKILFLLKAKSSYSENSNSIGSGLFNSASFVNNMLNEEGIESHVVEVQDNNSIDKEVTKYSPDIVIIEALWVVPEKFKILTKLHPDVKWIVRLHSNIPFLANEGVAIEWIKGYNSISNVFIATNFKLAKEALQVLNIKPIYYLPNYYPVTKQDSNRINRYNKEYTKSKSYIDIGCFGAIRPLKNQLIQAMAAIQFANKNNIILNFHINGTRIEQKGDSNLKNIQALFKNTKHNLAEHTWYSHEDFLETIKFMDLGMQISLSETYNIVTADFVNLGIPVVVSHEIEFVNPYAKTSCKDIEEIVDTIEFTLKYKTASIDINKYLLKRNSNKAKKEWLKLK